MYYLALRRLVMGLHMISAGSTRLVPNCGFTGHALIRPSLSSTSPLRRGPPIKQLRRLFKLGEKAQTSLQMRSVELFEPRNRSVSDVPTSRQG